MSSELAHSSLSPGRPFRRSTVDLVPNFMNAANIDNQISNARENLRRLIEQATDYSGAADDALISERVPANHPSAGDSFRRGLLPF